VKVLLNECVDWRLARDLVGHDVKTARQMGWTAIKNGELLALASRQFEVFVTVDRNLSFQQNLVSYRSLSSCFVRRQIASPSSDPWYQSSWRH
jgi:Domain of unknown function (DUF5615)